MKQDTLTNQTKSTNKSNDNLTNPPKKKKKNQIKPTRKTYNLCVFRFSPKRELEMLKRKIRVERNKPEVAEREMEEEPELQLGRETQRAHKETRWVRRWISKFLGLWGDFKSIDLDSWNPRWIWAKFKSISFNLLKQRIWIWAFKFKSKSMPSK